MATINARFMTLADAAAQTDKTGEITQVIEMLDQVDPWIDHAPAFECNEGLAHLTTVRTGLPTGAWTALYEGIPQEKARTRQVRDTTARLEGLSSVDTRLLQVSKNPAQLRLNESAAFLEGMTQSVSEALVYSDASNPRKFLGLMPRFSSLTAESGGQIVDAGGTGSDNASILFVTWGERSVHLLYPQLAASEGMAGAAGITRKEMGVQRVTDAAGDPYYVKEEHFGIHIGLSVRDWRNVVRIANIDVSDIASLDILALMRKAYYRLEARVPAGGGGTMIGGKTCIYMNRTVLEAYDADVTDKSNVQLTIEQAGGDYKAASAYRGIPIYEMDTLLNTETRVT